MRPGCGFQGSASRTEHGTQAPKSIWKKSAIKLKIKKAEEESYMSEKKMK